MTDDEIGSDVGPRFEGIVNRVRVPDHVLERAAAVVILGRGPATRLVGDAHDAFDDARFFARNERDTVTVAGHLPRDHSELRRKVLVQEQHVHSCSYDVCASRRRASHSDTAPPRAQPAIIGPTSNSNFNQNIPAAASQRNSADAAKPRAACASAIASAGPGPMNENLAVSTASVGRISRSKNANATTAMAAPA